MSWLQQTRYWVTHREMPKSPYSQLPGLWTGTESHSGGESFSPSELLVLPSSSPLGRSFAGAGGLLSTNLFVPAQKSRKEVVNGGRLLSSGLLQRPFQRENTIAVLSVTNSSLITGNSQVTTVKTTNQGRIGMIKRKVPFAFWEFRGLEPLVNAVGRGILVGRFLRLLSSGGGYGSSKQLKDKCRRKFKFMPLC